MSTSDRPATLCEAFQRTAAEIEDLYAPDIAAAVHEPRAAASAAR